MAINLGDIAAFATGVIKADEKDTQERLKDRRVELQADRQFYINMKTKKYESELKTFEEENKKYKAIQAVNAKAKSGIFNNEDGEINPGAYGKAYLQETNPTLLLQYETLYKDNPILLNKKLATFGGDSISKFKTTNTRDSLDNKLKLDVDAITADYKTQLENARGDSKLINAIIGKRDKKIADTIQANEDGKNGVIKAKEIAIETSTDTEPDLKFGKVEEFQPGLEWKIFKKNNPDWIKRYNSLKDKVVWDSVNKRDNFLNFIKTSDVLGAANEGNFTLTNNDTKIEGLNDSARAILKTYEMVYNSVVNDIYAKELAGNNVDITQIDNFISVAEVNKRVNNLIENRGFRVDLGDGIGDDGKVDFIGVVPLNVVDRNGGFELDSGATKYLNMQYVKDNYKSFLETEADKLIAESPKRFEEATNKKGAAMAIVQSSIENGGKYNSMFKNNLKVDRDNPNTPENENITQNPKVLADEKMANEGNSVGSVVKIVDDGKGNMVFRPNNKGKYKGIRIMKDGTGFKQKQPNGNWKKVSWQSVKDGNNVDKLSPLMKLKYDQWLSGNTEQAGTSVTSRNINSVDNDKIFSDMISEIEADITGKKKTRK